MLYYKNQQCLINVQRLGENEILKLRSLNLLIVYLFRVGDDQERFSQRQKFHFLRKDQNL